MKRSIIFFLLLFSVPALAEEDPLKSIHRTLMDEAFVVETSDEDATETLDRISGDIDLGFSSKEDTYQSEHHYKAGPFGQSEAMDSLDREAAYQS